MTNTFIPMQLRVFRKDKTLQEVSRDTGISVSFLSDIERGRTLPSLKSLITLCDYYGKHIDDVFCYLVDVNR